MAGAAMWRESGNQDDEGGRGVRRLQHFITRQPRESNRSERRFSNSDHADGARHAASSPAAPPVHNWQPDNPNGWQTAEHMSSVYEPPPEPSPWWEALKMAVILSLTIGGALYGVYALNAYLEDQHKEIPVYGDTAAPPPGRGTGPPNVAWGGTKH